MQWSYCSLALSHGFDCFKQPSAHRHLLKINHLACSKERLKTRSILIYSELKNDSVDDNNIIVWQERSNDAIKGTGTKINMFGCCKLVLYSKLWQKWQCWWQQYVLCGRKDQVTPWERLVQKSTCFTVVNDFCTNTADGITWRPHTNTYYSTRMKGTEYSCHNREQQNYKA